MEAGQLEQPLQEEALIEIERSLRRMLKARRLSDSFVERCSEDAIQKGLLEYLRARRSGKQIRDRHAFVVHAAFQRAVDELRREARRADGATVEALLNLGRGSAPASEELALERVEAQELHAAIEGLSPEERQVLALHYFDQLSAKRSAEVLFCSEATYRRLLKRALSALGERLGVPAPDPGSGFAFEIGLAAWTSIGGARVALAHRPLEQLAGLLDRGREGLAWISARVRDPLARAEASGTAETAGAIASGPAGKVLGGCVAAAVVCVVGGTVGLGVARHPATPIHQKGAVAAGQRHAVRAAPKAKPQVQAPIALGLSNTGQSQPPAVKTPEAAKQPKPPPTERQRVEQQFSGVSRAAAESSGSTEAEASAAESETVVVAPESGGGTSSSSEPTQQEFGFEGKP